MRYLSKSFKYRIRYKHAIIVTYILLVYIDFSKSQHILLVYVEFYHLHGNPTGGVLYTEVIEYAIFASDYPDIILDLPHM